jgi:hypothetical protein
MPPQMLNSLNTSVNQAEMAWHRLFPAISSFHFSLFETFDSGKWLLSIEQHILDTNAGKQLAQAATDV